jgi:flagellar motor switch protein FliN
MPDSIPSDAVKSPVDSGSPSAPSAVAESGPGEVPTYAQGLLRIRIPVHVTLASQRKSIQEIIELGPGSIVKFDKTCDEQLQLMVGDRPLAQGEVVKVGDKFGLKISGLVSQ